MAKLYVSLCSLALVALATTSVSATGGAEFMLFNGLLAAGNHDGRIDAPKWIAPKEKKRPVDHDTEAIHAKYMKKASGPFGKVVDTIRKVSEKELAEAEEHGTKMVRGLERIQVHYNLHYGAAANHEFPYEENFAKFKGDAEQVKFMSRMESGAEQLNKAIDLYVAMDPTKCDPEAIRNMQTLIQFADLEWFMRNNRWIRTPPATNVQRHIAMSAYEQSQNCAAGKKN